MRVRVLQENDRGTFLERSIRDAGDDATESMACQFRLFRPRVGLHPTDVRDPRASAGTDVSRIGFDSVGKY